ncbi:MAG: DNA repair protein RecN [Ruminococcaceae bacterium]|nr:DNA repair protein RecN [Oscillospiraceae bacterium]
MLKHLSIKNVAVIEAAEIDFDRGFSVLTGETGAGKSIIIDAINMLKGERASKNMIRAGETKARVDGEFETDNISAEKIADILGTEAESQIIISREMNSDGKNTIRVNGIPVNLSMLKMIGEYLVNIHGQHDNTSLLSVKSHIGFLDSFGGEKTAELLRCYGSINSEYHRCKDELEQINTDEQENLRKKDMLTFQTDELMAANLRIGEDEELERRKLELDNASKISENTSVAYDMLYGSDEGTTHDLLWSAIKKLEEISDFSEDISAICEALRDAGYAIDEQARELKGYSDHVFYNEEEANEIEERLELIYTLKRKYGNTIADILSFYEEALAELGKIETSGERAAELEAVLTKLDADRKTAANALTEQRTKCARELEQRVQRQLADLNMAKVEFEVVIQNAEYSSLGADNVEFMICTNVGEQKKPLAQIASGGELSRIMLAIKNVLAGYDTDKTVIFDEIDTGVSGNAAQKIGEKLFSMSVKSQVLCITHLPQISALADTHYLIKKNVAEGRTLTQVTALDKNGRIEEVARTLTGAEVSVIARENARQLIEEAEVIKELIKKQTN